ncbi:MAG: hypothetical protein LWY06_15395 [Firmicutes bacterium]|nr:hypothetical protein [Bacillota bacterium]
MLFLTYENSFYELLREYLINSSVMHKDLSAASFNNALIARSQELGFSYVEEYCNYVMILPFLARLKEIRLLVPNYQPFSLFQFSDQLEAITDSFIKDVMDYKAGDKEDQMARIKKILNTPLDVKQPDEPELLKILIVEGFEGEEAFSLGMRLKTTLSEEKIPRITVLEANPQLNERAKKGFFFEGKVMGMKDNYRSLYLEKTPGGSYTAVSSIKSLINFRKLDFLTQNLESEFNGYFHIVSCNSVCRIYPQEVVRLIVDKAVRYLQPGGLLLITIPDLIGENLAKCVEKVKLGNSFVYRRKACPLPEPRDDAFQQLGTSQTDRLLYAKAYFMNNQPEEANKIVDTILNKNIDSLKGNYFKGDIYFKLKQYDKALLQYSKVILIDPLSLPAYYNSAVISLLKNDMFQAEEFLDKINAKLENFDDSILHKNYNIGIESFKTLVGELAQKIITGDTINIEGLRRRAIELKDTKLEAPDIKIPDPFELRKTSKEEPKQVSAYVDPTKKAVVNISELPSTRDYGEHDPWLKKQKELEEMRKRGELDEGPPVKPLKEVPGAEQAPQKQQAKGMNLQLKPQPVEEEDDGSGMVFRVPKSFGDEPKETAPQAKKEDKSKKTVKKPAPSGPPAKLYLKPMSPDMFDEADNEPEEEPEEPEIEETEEEEEEKAVVQAPRFRLALKKTGETQTTGPREVTLPPNFMHSIDALLLKEDIDGIKLLLDSYSNLVSPGQQEILRLIQRLISVFKSRKKNAAPQGAFKGKLKEVHEEIQKINELLQDKNLLEASILFHKVLKMRAAIDDIPEKRRERLKRVKLEIEEKQERYQQFVDRYFTDPFKIFQAELWAVLAQLTPPTNLLEMGKKYGLDPQFLSVDHE